MNMLAWQRQKRELRLEDFTGCRCWAACDLASKTDVAALVLLFEKDDAIWCIPRFYAPERAAEEQGKYRDFASDGSLILTPGDSTDYAFIEEEIRRLGSTHRLEDIAFDDWQANYLMTRLMDARVKVIAYNQTVRNMSEPMKELEARVLSRRFWHDGNPVMTWMMGNVVARIDAKDNIYPRKEFEANKACRIDGPVAAIMAVGRMIATREPTKDYQVLFL
jgi:phage terminase large subunit-like protein